MIRIRVLSRIKKLGQPSKKKRFSSFFSPNNCRVFGGIEHEHQFRPKGPRTGMDRSGETLLGHFAGIIGCHTDHSAHANHRVCTYRWSVLCVPTVNRTLDSRFISCGQKSLTLFRLY